MELNGLHHVTAVTALVQNNVNFYTRFLGMRLVAKSINQDDTSAYHLFYGDKYGSPGTDLTFFDWPHVVKNVNGAGSLAFHLGSSAHPTRRGRRLYYTKEDILSKLVRRKIQ